MAAVTLLRDLRGSSASLTLVEDLENGEADGFAQLVAHLVALAGGPVEPALIASAALILRDEHLLELPRVTFGCNYDLDVRSFELEQGYVRALNAGWLKLRLRKVTAKSKPRHVEVCNSPASARAQELFALGREELVRLARHHLLRESEDRSDQAG